MPSVAIEQPLGLTMEIMRLRSFARAWQDRNRKRDDDEPVRTGALQDWVERVQRRFDEDALEDVRRLFSC